MNSSSLYDHDDTAENVLAVIRANSDELPVDVNSAGIVRVGADGVMTVTTSDHPGSGSSLWGVFWEELAELADLNCAYNDETLIEFLTELNEVEQRRVLLIWDGLPSHRSRRMSDWVASQRHWLAVELLPGYAPDINPIEQVWGWLKSKELANLCSDTIGGVADIAEDGLDHIGSDAELCVPHVTPMGRDAPAPTPTAARLPPHVRQAGARLKGGARLEQIQLSLGHASIRTTERYLRVEQDLTDAPCDYLGLRL